MVTMFGRNMAVIAAAHIILAVLLFEKVTGEKGQIKDGENKNKNPYMRACTSQYRPHCGTDGRTYSNKCFLELAKYKNKDLKVKHSGPCRNKCDKACTRESESHCGSDGITYGNKCMFEIGECKNKSLTLLYARECGSHEGFCPRNKYGNCSQSCAEDKDCKKTEKCCPGKCGEACIAACGALHCPVCRPGEERLTEIAENGCAVCKCQIKDGEEKKPILCMRACTSHYRPYCGTDGRTYSNKCFLDLAKCKNKDLKEKHSGPCRKKCDKPCTREYAPHCGSDGRTYGNKCMFEIGECKNRSLTLLYARECGSHQGFCPRNKYGNCSNRCADDKDCKKTEKCCPGKCGAACIAACGAFSCPTCRPDEKRVTEIAENGCAVCKCESLCKLKLCKFCAHGYKTDRFACPTCKCKKAPKCKKLNCRRRKPCFGGYGLKKNGCPTCSCRPRAPCPRMRCPPSCPSGRRKMLPSLFGCYECVCRK